MKALRATLMRNFLVSVTARPMASGLTLSSLPRLTAW